MSKALPMLPADGPGTQGDMPFPRLVLLQLLPGAVQMGAYALFAAFVLGAGAP